MQGVCKITWNALVVGFEVFQCSGTRISKYVGAGQNTAISLLITSTKKRKKKKKFFC